MEQGAEFKPHWAFSPPVLPEVPEKKDDWGTNEIDYFIYAKLQQNGLAPSEKAAPEKLLRRISFDLTAFHQQQHSWSIS